MFSGNSAVCYIYIIRKVSYIFLTFQTKAACVCVCDTRPFPT